MSRLGEYLKRSGSIQRTDNYSSDGVSGFSLDPVKIVFIAIVVLMGFLYFLRANNLVYFKGATFEDIHLIEDKFRTSENDYKNFKTDDTLISFIKASYSGDQKTLIEIVGKTQSPRLLGVYHAIYGDPKESVRILSEEYVKGNDSFLLHYLVYSLLKIGDVKEAERLVSGSDNVEGQTFVLIAAKMEKLGRLEKAENLYELSLKKDIPSDLKSSIKIKLNLLRR